MNCDRILDLLSDYLEDGLAEGDRAVVAAHLGACARCAAEEKGLSETISLLADIPREEAPPELLDRIMSGIERESAATPARGTFFPLGRVRIPLEAAAAVLLLALVYGIQRGMPVRPGLPAGEGGTPRATATTSPVPGASSTIPVAPPSAGDAAKERSVAARSEEAPRPTDDMVSVPAPAAEAAVSPAARTESREAALSPAGGKAEYPGAAAEPGREAVAMNAPPAHPAARALPSPLPPAVTAARVSSAGEAIQSKVFAAPPSRMLKALAFGREVTLEVASAERAGIEERIVAAAERLGGAAHPGAAPVAEGAQPLPPAAVRVHLPAASAGAFLDALKELGTIPPEGMPAAVDLPAGPSPGIAAYTVRIRVR